MYKALPLIVVLFCLINYGFGGTVEPEASNVTVISGKMLEISWTVSPASGEIVNSLSVSVLPNTTVKVLDGFIPFPQTHAIILFGVGRLSATFVEPTYKLMLKNVSYTDKVTFQLLAVFTDGDKFDGKKSNIQVTVNAPTTPRPTVTPTPTDKGKIKGGIIAIIVIAAITFVALIVVGIVLFLRWKKNHPSKTDTSEQMKSLKTNKSTEEGVHYASTDVTVPPEKRDQQVYAQVDRSGGGGRDGPKPEVVKSDYAQMQVDADGYPASGPTSSTPPDENEDGISSGVMV